MTRSLVLAFLAILVLIPAARAQDPQQSPSNTQDAPPAKPITRVFMGGTVTAKMLTHQVNPEYPLKARHDRISGTVRLRVVIGKDGTVQSLDAVSGPPLLVKAAIDAVRQWQYKVTLLGGKPVEVDTTVDVIFSLGA